MASITAIKPSISVEGQLPMIDIHAIVKIAVDAGEQILAVYQQDFTVVNKQDSSPLTDADMRAHHLICNRLAQLTPNIPVLSEESSAKESLDRMEWTRYWLVDPLDGTKEFVKRNGEFTVNIALIDNGVPVMGIVHAPALDISYWGELGRGAFKQVGQAAPAAIQAAQPPLPGKSWKVVGSRSHASADFETFMTALPNAELVSMGSSLKLCLVAEGAADLYPRFGPTSEWDTAAAQAVVEAAGGQVLRIPGLTTLRYNQDPLSLLNPWFIVCTQPHKDWANIKV